MTVLNLTIAADADDAYEFSNGTVTLVTSNTVDATNEYVGLRFTNVTIPPGSTIDSATLSVMPTNASFDEPKHTFYCEAADNGAAFTAGTTNFNISSRSRTTANVLWDVADLGSNGATFYSPPDIKALIQEVIDRPGWSSGNAIVVIYHGDADAARDLTIWGQENTDNRQAKLDITYTEGEPPEEIPQWGALMLMGVG